MNRDIFELTLTLLQAKGVFDKDKGVSAYKKILIEEISYFEKALKLGKLYKELSKLIVAVPLFEGSKMICYKTKYRSDIKYTNILNKIKELENE